MINANAAWSQDDKTSSYRLTWTKICKNRTKSRWTAKLLDSKEYFRDSTHSFCNFTSRKVNLDKSQSLSNHFTNARKHESDWRRDWEILHVSYALFQHRIILGTFNFAKSHSATPSIAVPCVFSAFCWFRCFVAAAVDCRYFKQF